MIRHRSTAGNSYDALRRNPTMRRQPLDQGTIAISVVAVQIKIFNLRLQLSEPKIEDAAQGKIIFHFRASLGPLHVCGLRVHILNLESEILDLKSGNRAL